jgi:hypothetical protein
MIATIDATQRTPEAMEFNDRTTPIDPFDTAADGPPDDRRRPPRTEAPWTPPRPAAEPDGTARMGRRTYHRPDERSDAAPVSLPVAEAPPSRRKATDLSFTRIAAGGLAAATAAALGSRLGVAGTIVGAAIVSVLSAVATVFYHRSMERTKRVMLEARDRLAVDGAVVPVARRTAATEPTEWMAPTEPREPTERFEPAVPVGRFEPAVPAVRRTVGAARASRRRRWIAVAGAAAAVFVLGMGVVTGIELASGGTLSGGGGTTVGRVLNNQQGAITTTTTVTTHQTKPSTGGSATGTTTTHSAPTSSASTSGSGTGTGTGTSSTSQSTSRSTSQAGTSSSTSP